MWGTNSRLLIGAVLMAATLGLPADAAAQGARDEYTRALARERVIRSADRPATAQEIREVVASYERLVRRYPVSGYSDNALWQAANLALLAHQQFGSAADRRNALRLLTQLEESYPASSLLPRVDETLAEIQQARPEASVPGGPPVGTAPPGAPAAAAAAAGPSAAIDSRARSAASSGTPAVEAVTIRGVTRTAIPDGVRVSIEMDGEILFHQERLDNPRRVFFDLKNARPVPALVDRTLRFPDDIVQEIRLGRHPQNTTRVVMEMNGVDSYSVFTLYNPYRLVVDFRKTGAPVAETVIPRLPAVMNVRTPPLLAEARPVAAGLVIPSPGVPSGQVAAAPIEKLSLPSRQAIPQALAAPLVPAANSNGRFSIARQLGLGVSRVVIDAGHGGHDPGAHGSGLNESELVLDVALRLRKLLENQPGVEVVMTRDTDVFVPLEERTAIANRESADLFLSIHANASTNLKAQGVETYFLNFASNPAAAAVAARENSASGKTMHSLPEIVRAITLNNKIDESRDFAELIQKAMVRKLASKNGDLRDLGVKQAPFVVLIGAGMPSVLAEISFITHRQEGALLKTNGYRQQIADALLDAVLGYQKSLKGRTAIATREQ